MPDPLTFLIDPVGVEDFFSRYWETAPLLHKSGNPTRFDHIFSLISFDHLLNTVYAHKPDSTNIRMAHLGTLLPFSDFTKQVRSSTREPPRCVLDLDMIMELYRDGATIILNRIHNMWAPVARLARELEAYFGLIVQVNGYLTPPHSQGFGIHYDTHDVFAAQISGSKKWRTYGNYMPLATPATPRNSEDIAAFVSGKGLASVGEQTAELVATPGDVIYIPRGFAHDAESTDELSLHLTIGLRATTWGEVMHDAVDTLVRRDPAFRASIVPRPNQEGLEKTRIEGIYAALLGRMKDCDVLEIVQTRIQDDSINRRGLLDGQLLQIAKVANIQLDSLVGVRSTERFRINQTNEKVAIAFRDKCMEFPTFVLPHLQSLQRRSLCRVSELPPGLDAEGKLVLVRRLVTEGLLKVYDSLDP